MPTSSLNAITKTFACAAAAANLFIGTGYPAHAASSNIVATVSNSQQRMDGVVDGRLLYHWNASTGRRGYVTPTGTFKPTRMHPMWHSRKYDNAPMPHSVFFHEGYAVHATPEIAALGRPASHGCVRLKPQNATAFFLPVRTAGADNTSIVITQ